jgi:hypothetical protein
MSMEQAAKSMWIYEQHAERRLSHAAPRRAGQHGLGRLPAFDTKWAADLSGTDHFISQAQLRTSPQLPAAPSLRVPRLRDSAQERAAPA